MSQKKSEQVRRERAPLTVLSRSCLSIWQRARAPTLSASHQPFSHPSETSFTRLVTHRGRVQGGQGPARAGARRGVSGKSALGGPVSLFSSPTAVPLFSERAPPRPLRPPKSTFLYQEGNKERWSYAPRVSPGALRPAVVPWWACGGTACGARASSARAGGQGAPAPALPPFSTRRRALRPPDTPSRSSLLALLAGEHIELHFRGKELTLCHLSPPSRSFRPPPHRPPALRSPRGSKKEFPQHPPSNHHKMAGGAIAAGPAGANAHLYEAKVSDGWNGERRGGRGTEREGEESAASLGPPPR